VKDLYSLPPLVIEPDCDPADAPPSDEPDTQPLDSEEPF
jgi:hypothetical protein